MTGDDLIRAIDQHWIEKAEALDAASDLGDLPARMRPGIAVVRNQIVDRHVNDRGMAKFHVGVQDNRPFLGFQFLTLWLHGRWYCTARTTSLYVRRFRQ